MDEPLQDNNEVPSSSNTTVEVDKETEGNDDTQIGSQQLEADTTDEMAQLLLPDQDDATPPTEEEPEEDTSGGLIGFVVSSPSYNSLAYAPTTPCLARWLIPLLALLTHACFLYGQIEPMWRLTQSQSVDVWWNATSATSRAAFSTIGIPHDLHLTLEDGSTIQTFTYSFAIQELWEAKGMPGTTLPRIASVLLALFSGLWPHLKLLLLNWTWLFMGSKRRTGMLHWLSCLGKWSLADILVVCVMVGVLHIDWNVDPDAIRLGVADHLEQLIQLARPQISSLEICTQILHYDCARPAGFERVKCASCTKFFDIAYDHDNWSGSTGRAILHGIDTSGSGVCSLRVIGMRGMYAFCGAVVVSILLSLLVDVFDYRAQEDERLCAHDANQSEAAQPLLMADEENNNGDNNEAPYTLMEDNGEVDEPMLEGAIRSHLNVETASHHDNNNVVAIPIRWFSCTHGFFSFLVLITAIFAVSLITMGREVHGAIPMLLTEILGMEWSKAYSLQSLSATTGAAGGWDIMLMSTFSLFIVVGPLLRASLCVLGHMLPGRLSTIQTFIDLVGAFCAWEVLVIAVAMICLLMPSITGTILQDARCQTVDPTGACFEVEFNVVAKTFGLVLASGALLVLISNTFSCFARKLATSTRRGR